MCCQKKKFSCAHSNNSYFFQTNWLSNPFIFIYNSLGPLGQKITGSRVHFSFHKVDISCLSFTHLMEKKMNPRWLVPKKLTNCRWKYKCWILILSLKQCVFSLPQQGIFLPLWHTFINPKWASLSIWIPIQHVRQCFQLRIFSWLCFMH